jgi:hypothetical protein
MASRNGIEMASSEAASKLHPFKPHPLGMRVEASGLLSVQFLWLQ